MTSQEEEPRGSQDGSRSPGIVRSSSWAGDLIGLAVTPKDEEDDQSGQALVSPLSPFSFSNPLLLRTDANSP